MINKPIHGSSKHLARLNAELLILLHARSDICQRYQVHIVTGVIHHYEARLKRYLNVLFYSLNAHDARETRALVSVEVRLPLIISMQVIAKDTILLQVDLGDLAVAANDEIDPGETLLLPLLVHLRVVLRFLLELGQRDCNALVFGITRIKLSDSRVCCLISISAILQI